MISFHIFLMTLSVLITIVLLIMLLAKCENPSFVPIPAFVLIPLFVLFLAIDIAKLITYLIYSDCQQEKNKFPDREKNACIRK